MYKNAVFQSLIRVSICCIYYYTHIHNRYGIIYDYTDSSFDRDNIKYYQKRISYNKGLSYENRPLNIQRLNKYYKSRGVLVTDKLIEQGCVFKEVKGEIRVLFYDHVMHKYIKDIDFMEWDCLQ